MVICLERGADWWPSWCHCHSLSLAWVKSRLVVPFWYQFTQVVPDKGPLNGCVCVLASVEVSVLKVLCTRLLSGCSTAVAICKVAWSVCVCLPLRLFVTTLNPTKTAGVLKTLFGMCTRVGALNIVHILVGSWIPHVLLSDWLYWYMPGGQYTQSDLEGGSTLWCVMQLSGCPTK